jgi:hypothetical protein
MLFVVLLCLYRAHVYLFSIFLVLFTVHAHENYIRILHAHVFQSVIILPVDLLLLLVV